MLQAPSVWHALAFLLFQFVFARHRSDEELRVDPTTESCFGSMGVCRGQAVPWPITPTLWRSDEEAIRRLGDAPLTAFARFLDEWLASARDGRLYLFDSLSTLGAATATAQHSRFPTNYVDFTFDPLTALHFACGPRELRGEWPEGEPARHAVIYMAGFRLATCMTSPSTGVLDPVIISTVAAENQTIFDSVREIASWPGEGREELGLLQEKIEAFLQLAREMVRGGAPSS